MLPGMESRPEKPQPRRKDLAQYAGVDGQIREHAQPGARSLHPVLFEKLQRRAHAAPQEAIADVQHHQRTNFPALIGRPLLRGGEKGVIGDALVLYLLDGVPFPQPRRIRRRALEVALTFQDGVRDDGGEVLQRNGGHQAEDGGFVFEFRQSGIQIRVHSLDIITRSFDLIVQVAVLAAVGRLLLDEGVDLRLLLRRHLLAKIPDAIDEERFALWKGESEAVGKHGCHRIAAVPPTLRCSASGKHYIAGLDTQIRRGWRRVIHGAPDPNRRALTLAAIYVSVNMLLMPT